MSATSLGISCDIVFYSSDSSTFSLNNTHRVHLSLHSVAVISFRFSSTTNDFIMWTEVSDPHCAPFIQFTECDYLMRLVLGQNCLSVRAYCNPSDGLPTDDPTSTWTATPSVQQYFCGRRTIFFLLTKLSMLRDEHIFLQCGIFSDAYAAVCWVTRALGYTSLINLLRVRHISGQAFTFAHDVNRHRPFFPSITVGRRVPIGSTGRAQYGTSTVRHFRDIISIPCQ